MPPNGIIVERSADVLPLLAGAAQAADAELDDLVPVLYDELRRLARRELRNERPGHTLSTTALVHEAYLELSRLRDIRWKSRAHFFGVCARVIRHVLVDHAMRHKAQKRGGGRAAVPLEEALAVAAERPEQWVDLDEALDRLAELSPRQARVVECRFFGGMNVEETGQALDMAPATVKRDWALARAWLNRELSQ
ncbi:MAG TPA: ECF-type sigma factor [Gemmatimonadaceae bacterium]|nr:ECF-type sigma factor [Gemmatimonadaceae bacterium]